MTFKNLWKRLSYQLPAITICFDPPFKPSVLEKYNITDSIFYGAYFPDVIQYDYFLLKFTIFFHWINHGIFMLLKTQPWSVLYWVVQAKRPKILISVLSFSGVGTLWWLWPDFSQMRYSRPCEWKTNTYCYCRSMYVLWYLLLCTWVLHAFAI